jgi:hypothetical protein
VPLPTIANCYRLTLHWVNGASGLPAESINVIHVLASGISEQDISDQFNTVLGSTTPDSVITLPSDFTLNTIDVIKLDGSSATQTFNYGDVSGATGGDWISQGCMVVSLHTAQRGAQGRGRIYLGPCAESKQSNGSLTTGADPVGAWEDVQSGLGALGIDLAVASYVHSAAHTVTSISIHPFLRTQRRRAQEH